VSQAEKRIRETERKIDEQQRNRKQELQELEKERWMLHDELKKIENNWTTLAEIEKKQEEEKRILDQERAENAEHRKCIEEEFKKIEGQEKERKDSEGVFEQAQQGKLKEYQKKNEEAWIAWEGDQKKIWREEFEKIENERKKLELEKAELKTKVAQIQLESWKTAEESQKI